MTSVQSQNEGEDIAPTQSQPWCLKWVGSQHHALAAFPWETPGTNQARSLEGLGARLDGHEKSRHNQDSIPGPAIQQRFAVLMDLSLLPLPLRLRRNNARSKVLQITEHTAVSSALQRTLS